MVLSFRSLRSLIQPRKDSAQCAPLTFKRLKGQTTDFPHQVQFTITRSPSQPGKTVI